MEGLERTWLELESSNRESGRLDVYHHHDKDDQPSANVKIEKNTKGFNYEITIMGVHSAEELNELLYQLKAQIDLFIANYSEG